MLSDWFKKHFPTLAAGILVVMISSCITYNVGRHHSVDYYQAKWKSLGEAEVAGYKDAEKQWKEYAARLKLAKFYVDTTTGEVEWRWTVAANDRGGKIVYEEIK